MAPAPLSQLEERSTGLPVGILRGRGKAERDAGVVFQISSDWSTPYTNN
jgi:hypothetical protein